MDFKAHCEEEICFLFCSPWRDGNSCNNEQKFNLPTDKRAVQKSNNLLL